VALLIPGKRRSSGSSSSAFIPNPVTGRSVFRLFPCREARSQIRSQFIQPGLRNSAQFHQPHEPCSSPYFLFLANFQVSLPLLITVDGPRPGVDNPRRRPATMSRLRLATWNLRYDVLPDNVPVSASLAALPDPLRPPRALLVGEQPWSARRVPVARALFASQFDLAGTYTSLGSTRCMIPRNRVPGSTRQAGTRSRGAPGQ